MSTQTIKTLNQRVFELISRQMDIPKEQISLDSLFAADLGFDSLNLVEFVMNVEEEFDITVPGEQSDAIITVKDAVQAIQKLITCP